MLRTASNLSVQLSDGSFWITASWCNREQLGISDFIRIGSDGKVLEQLASELSPSAEEPYLSGNLLTIFPGNSSHIERGDRAINASKTGFIRQSLEGTRRFHNLLPRTSRRDSRSS
ncbi:MAG: hypothetical protein F6J86_18675 [Symploca sp. SIO1B1]|nr:hypothetical protein [Symploca sp. SIO1C2]NER50497.1 hypothetical protein [Symploca sp. SIO1A3]NER95836.1 hypothetical protein [Symploca sp. SIO1B1]